MHVGEVLGQVVEQVLALGVGQIGQSGMHRGDVVLDLARRGAHAASFPVISCCIVSAKPLQTFVESSSRARPALLIA